MSDFGQSQQGYLNACAVRPRHHLNTNGKDLSIEKHDACGTDLVRSARGGCEVALGVLFQKLKNYLLLVANKNLGNDLRAKVGASDIVQQSMLDARQNMLQFHGHSENEFRAWLRVLVLHNLIDTARQFRKTQARDISLERCINISTDVDVLTQDKTPSWYARKRETDAELEHAISNLCQRQQKVLVGHHREGKSFVQIALELGLTESAVRKLWHRAIKRLQHQLAK